jgi:nucleoside-specific outer membrane channel protein Tsx
LNIRFAFTLTVALAATAVGARAANWSDASVGVRYGTQFAEPGVGTGIAKTIFNFSYIGGDSLGTNFFTGDLLQSDDKDPEAGGGGGAQEFYGIFQRGFSLGALSGTQGGYGPFKDLSLTIRADLSSKNTQFAARVRKLRPGISASLPLAEGFWDVGVQLYHETNHNGIVGKDVHFKTTWALASVWSVPAGPGEFGGFLDVVGPKGQDGFGADTKTEVLLQMHYLFKVGSTGLKAGVAYEYWNNKFGNEAVADPTGGSKASTPMLMAEYHF